MFKNISAYFIRRYLVEFKNIKLSLRYINAVFK
ncbi:hypothetical protein GGR21_003680 [Dysgonomonas hofstadii]|uniref:Uncharacterized protein n=1 Tax=Dysgonomonas hofstadii TaxID=637886 RepID=A0A840CSU7_9BACT|nr:hypothetical protein [Dysgonomonas hofstadii]